MDNHISLNHTTLACHERGGKTLTELNRQKSWLTVEEDKNIVNFTIEMA
jgi:hypothetical protein